MGPGSGQFNRLIDLLELIALFTAWPAMRQRQMMTEYVGVDNVKRGQFVGYIERQRVKMGFLFPSSKQERKKEK